MAGVGGENGKAKGGRKKRVFPQIFIVTVKRGVIVCKGMRELRVWLKKLEPDEVTTVIRGHKLKLRRNLDVE